MSLKKLKLLLHLLVKVNQLPCPTSPDLWPVNFLKRVKRTASDRSSVYVIYRPFHKYIVCIINIHIY